MNDTTDSRLAAIEVEVKHVAAGVVRIEASIERTHDKQEKRIDAHDVRISALELHNTTQSAVVGAALTTSKAWYATLVAIAAFVWSVAPSVLHKLGVVF